MAPERLPSKLCLQCKLDRKYFILRYFIIGPDVQNLHFNFAVAGTHKETKQFFTLYNTLDDTKLYLGKEVSFRKFSIKPQSPPPPTTSRQNRLLNKLLHARKLCMRNNVVHGQDEDRFSFFLSESDWHRINFWIRLFDLVYRKWVQFCSWKPPSHISLSFVIRPSFKGEIVDNPLPLFKHPFPIPLIILHDKSDHNKSKNHGLL